MTILGWALLIKGFVYLVAPKSLMRWGRACMKNPSWIRTWLVVALVLGIYLAYKGFGN